MKHVVMFSSGAGSWAAARRVADEHGVEDLWLVFADVKGDNDNEHAGEDQDNYRFLTEAAANVLGSRYPEQLVWLKDGRDIWQVFRDRRYLGNTRQANCSIELKQKPARAWLEANCDPEQTTIYVGIDWSESHRLPKIEAAYLPYAAKAPMCEAPYLDKDQVLALLAAEGIEPPRLYGMGFAHANCGGFCVRAGQAHFRRLLDVNPERYAYHEGKEEEIRDYLGQDISILRDRRDRRTTPLTLRRFREQLQGAHTLLEAAGGDRRALEDLTDDWGGCGCFVDTADPS